MLLLSLWPVNYMRRSARRSTSTNQLRIAVHRAKEQQNVTFPRWDGQRPRLTGFPHSSTLPAIMRTEVGDRMIGAGDLGRTNPAGNDALLAMIDRLGELYRGFPWESQVWKREGDRRSPYRTLILFGLSARTKDRLLVQMCCGFFNRFPKAKHVIKDWVEEDSDSFVRLGQKPFIESAVQVITNHGGCIPPDKDGLTQIKGVGEKIAECVIAYGWGGEALPLDGNGCRVVERFFGLAAGAPVQSLRGLLKNLYRSCRPWMEERGLAMVDLHEMVRLHGQTVCTKAPKCFLCPVAACRSRQAEYHADSFLAVDPTIWRDWRELLLEPVSVDRR